MSYTSASSLVAQSMPELVTLIVDNFRDHDPNCLQNLGQMLHSFPIKVIPPYPLRTKINNNYDDLGEMFEKIKIKIPYLMLFNTCPIIVNFQRRCAPKSDSLIFLEMPILSK